MRTLLLFLALFLLSCSTPQPKNGWQYEATSSLNDYKKHFLQNRLLRAKLDLSRTQDSALQSANLSTLIDVELSVCALNISTLKPDSCKKAEELLTLEPNEKQKAYLHLLQNRLNKDEISLLPKPYQEYAKANFSKDDPNPILLEITPLSSKLIASALSVETITKNNIELLIQDLSFHGYKNPLVNWLKVLIQKETEPEKKEILQAKLKILITN